MRFGFTLPAMAGTANRTSRPKAGRPAGGEAVASSEDEKPDESLENAAAEHGENGAADVSGDGGNGDGGNGSDDGHEEPPEEPPEEVEARYSAEELRAEARLRFGCSPHLVAGALTGKDQDSWTVAEARDLIETFRAQEFGE